MKISKKDLKDRVWFWQDQLRDLGLIQWDIDVQIDGSEGEERTTNAHVTCSSHYDSAWMVFSESFIKDTNQRSLDKTIIHELLHIAMRDFDHEITKAEEFMGAVGKEVWNDSVEHARESLIERLARSIYVAAESDVVRSS